MECITDVSAGNTSWSLTMNFVISVGIFAQEDLHPCLAFVVIPCSSVAGWHHLKSCPVCSDFNLWGINLLIRLFSWRTLCLSFAKLIDSFIDLMPWFGMGSFSWSSPEESLWCAVLLLLDFCQMLSADVVASNKTAPALVRDLCHLKPTGSSKPWHKPWHWKGGTRGFAPLSALPWAGWVWRE